MQQNTIYQRSDKDTMQLRALGSTGLVVTPIGLGLAALGRPGYINLGHADDMEHSYEVEAMEKHAHAVLDAAWLAGIRYFDVARSYGRGEQFLGDWLSARHLSTDHATIGSKWGYTYTANWQVDAEVHEVKEHSLAVLKQQWEESQQNLGDYLSLYQIHSATLESGVLDSPDVLGELARLKSNGMFIGLTVSGEQQAQIIRRALEIEVNGEKLFDSVQATWNLLEPSAGVALQEAHQAGLGIIIKEALANGRLTSRADATEHDQQNLEFLTLHAERLLTTVDALALAAVLAQPWVDVVLSGAAKKEHLESNLRALTIPWNDELAQELAGLAEEPADYWQTRKNLAWN